MVKQILKLLSAQQRHRGIYVGFTVLLRSMLDFVGIAALIPVLLVVIKQDSSRRQMLLLCGAVLLFVVLKNILIALLARVQSNFQLDIYSDFSKRMFANYYRRGLLFLKGKSSVHLAHEVNYICLTFSLCVLAPLFGLVGNVLLVLLIVTALLIWEPLAGLLLCSVFSLLAVNYVYFVRNRLRKYGQEELEARRRMSRTVVETFRGYPELEIANAFHISQTSFNEAMEFVHHNRVRTEMYQLIPTFLSEAALVFGLALLISTGKGDLSIMSGVFAVAAFRLIPAVRGILNGWVTIQNNIHSIKIVAEGLDEKETETAKDNQTEKVPFSFNKSLELCNLAFAFPDGHTLFNHVNLKISRGERIGIRGASGSGKSTLFNLLLGFLTPTEGEVRIDGRCLTTANRKEWHRLVGYVPQEIFIIEGTLAGNIALGQPVVDHNKMLKVLEQVQLREWFDELPLGFDTPLGEYGSRLSGGQKQRIGIARALYKEAEVLFFDEATSSLDNKTEREINQALETLSERHKELTLIVIAHRESSLAFCDRIYDLDKNEIIDNKI